MRLCGFDIGPELPFFLIAGTCVVESEQLAVDTAGTLKEICDRLEIPLVYKSSFDKANRSSGTSFRGPGEEEGLRVLAEVKRQVAVPVLTDVHEDTNISVATADGRATLGRRAHGCAGLAAQPNNARGPNCAWRV